MTSAQFDNQQRYSPAFALEIKAQASGVLSGMASTFGGEPDSYGDVIAPGAFAESLKEWQDQKATPPMLWAHDQTRPIGSWHELRETGTGLEVTGQLNLNTQAGREAHEHAKAGDVRGLSIGFSVRKDGSEKSGRSRLLTGVKLWEISLVTIPANRNAMITEAKSFEQASDLRKFLRDVGLSKAAAEKVTAGGWSALQSQEEKAAVEAEAIKQLGAAARLFTR